MDDDVDFDEEFRIADMVDLGLACGGPRRERAWRVDPEEMEHGLGCRDENARIQRWYAEGP